MLLNVKNYLLYLLLITTVAPEVKAMNSMRCAAGYARSLYGRLASFMASQGKRPFWNNYASFGSKLARPRFAFARPSGAARSYAGYGKKPLAVLLPTTILAGAYLHQQKQETATLWADRADGKDLSKRAMITSFVQDCKKFEHHNASIPAHIKNDIDVRIATYNVHNWRDPYGAKNFDRIVETIKTINADVLIIQECAVFDRQRIAKAIGDCGYTHALFSATINGKRPMGNMIVSKYPLHQTTTKTYDADQKDRFERRNFMQSTVELPNGTSISLFGTHLDVWDKTEKKRTQEIGELADHAARIKGNVLIGADFNAVRARDYQYTVAGKKVWNLLDDAHRKRTGIPVPTSALERLEQQQFTDSFTRAKQPSPRFTVWSGTAVDFLYLNKDWKLPIKGCYVHYSAASDHLPVIMDIDLAKKSSSSRKFLLSMPSA